MMKRTDFKISEKYGDIKWEKPNMVKKVLFLICIIIAFFVIMYLGYFTAEICYNNFSEHSATQETQNHDSNTNF